MKQEDVKNFVRQVQQTEIDIHVENGRITKNKAKGTIGSIAFVFSDIYAKLILGFSDSEKNAVSIIEKINGSVQERIKEYYNGDATKQQQENNQPL